MYFSNQVQRFDGDHCFDLYLSEINKYCKPVSPEKELMLFYAYRKNGDESAKQKIIYANLRFVVTVAKSHVKKGIPVGDLISAGNMGLIKAIDKFDTTRGFRFITCAVSWINQSIISSFQEDFRTVRVPPQSLEFIRKMERTSEKFYNLYGLLPTPEELAVILHDDLDKAFSRKKHRTEEEEEQTYLENISKICELQASAEYVHPITYLGANEEEKSLLDHKLDFTFKTDKAFDDEEDENHKALKILRKLPKKNRIILETMLLEDVECSTYDILRKLGLETSRENYRKIDELCAYALSRLRLEYKRAYACA